MMAGNHMSLKKPRRHLVKEPLTAATCVEFFDHLQGRRPLYICVIGSPGATPRLYIENGQGPGRQGLVRVFFRQEDVLMYMDLISIGESIDPTAVRYWETDAESLVTMLNTVDSKKRQAGLQGVRAITTVCRNDKEFTGLIDMETFWTADRAVVV